MSLITHVRCTRIPAFSGDLRNGGTNGNVATHFKNDGKTLLIVFNHSGGGTTEVVNGVPDEDGRDATISASATDGKFYIFGPLNPAIFNERDGDTYPGFVKVTAGGSGAVDYTSISYGEAQYK